MRTGKVMIALIALAIIFIGARFLVDAAAAASGYGIPARPDDPYLAVKGVRDVASGLIIGMLLLFGTARALAFATLAATIIPIGDAAIVLAHGGPPTIAYGVHGATAAFMVIAAVLILRSRSAG